MKEALVVAVEAIGPQTPVKQAALPQTVTNAILADHFENSVTKVADVSLMPGYADTNHVPGVQAGAQADLQNQMPSETQHLMSGYADSTHGPGASSGAQQDLQNQMPSETQHLMPGYADSTHGPGASSGAQQDLQNQMPSETQHLTPGYADSTHGPGAQPGAQPNVQQDWQGYSPQEFGLRPGHESPTAQRRVADYLQGFTSRASNLGGVQNADGTDLGTLTVASDKPPSQAELIEQMRDLQAHSIEANLLITAASQGTKTVNDLMKGQ